MLKYLPAPLKGTFNYGVLTVNTLIQCVPLFMLAGLKLIPQKNWQKLCSKSLINIAEGWISINNWALKNTQQTQYHISGDTAFNQQGWYMVISNHQTWADILILQKVFNHQIPFLKFFLKKELIYVPIIGLCWWALDFPFMRRYTKAFLAKNPHMKGKDLEITRKACEKFKYTPVSIMNFLEGTRFTQSKHDRQQSPYAHLLKPKSAGIAYALNIMQDQIDTLVDVTIYYADGIPTFWQFAQGKPKNIYIDIHVKQIPPHLKSGDYENDPVFKQMFQTWVNELWQSKEDTLAKLANKAS